MASAGLRLHVLVNLKQNPATIVRTRGLNKHRRPTKRVCYFAQRSRLLFSPKEEATSTYDVVNK